MSYNKLNVNNGEIYKSNQKKRLYILLQFIKSFSSIYNPKSLSIAELGSYPGIMGAILSESGYSVEGFDIIASQIPEGNKNKYSSIHQCDLEKPIRLIKNQFKIAISFAVIEHLASNPLQYLSNSFGLLDENGLFLIQTPNKSFFIHRIKFIFGKTIDEKPLNVFLTKQNEGFLGHVILYNPNELIEMLKYIGYNKFIVKYFNSYIGGNFLKRAIVNIISIIPSFRNQFLIIAMK
jgi:2-polyprenyl-3-methyl-5-hydroxy-6-metoxy-1,4-benzoquinol methylase